MIRRLFYLLALAVFGFGQASAAAPERDPSLAPAGDYRLDPQRASLSVTTSVLGGLYRYPLRFGKLSGGFEHDAADWRATRVTISVDPRSVEAAHASAVRAAVEDFEPDRFPVIRFASRTLSLEPDGEGKLSGDLTMRGVTRPIVLDVTFKGLNDAGPEARLRFSGVGRVKRSDFGLTAGRPFAGDVADLVFEVEFVRK